MAKKNNKMMTIAEYEKLTGKKYDPIEYMTIEEYKTLFKLIRKMAQDADCFGLFEMILDRDVEKAKYIQAIMEDVREITHRRVEHIFDYKQVEYDYFEIMDAAYED